MERSHYFSCLSLIEGYTVVCPAFDWGERGLLKSSFLSGKEPLLVIHNSYQPIMDMKKLMVIVWALDLEIALSRF